MSQGHGANQRRIAPSPDAVALGSGILLSISRSTPVSSTSNKSQPNTRSRVNQSVVPDCSFFEADTPAPESSSPGGIQFCGAAVVAERAAIIHRAAPSCRRIVAKREDGRWLCLSCAEPHTITAPGGSGAYSPEHYATTEKGRREARVRAGFCAECGQPRGIHGNARLCAVHRRKSAERKRRARERATLAIRDNLYGHRADITWTTKN